MRELLSLASGLVAKQEAWELEFAEQRQILKLKADENTQLDDTVKRAIVVEFESETAAKLGAAKFLVLDALQKAISRFPTKKDT